MCFAFVGLDNKLYKMHGTYIKNDHLCIYVILLLFNWFHAVKY
jgi:hypothetical protein